MKKHIHGKTLALMLATTTTLQLTGAASQILNGVPILTANASTVEMGNSTTAANVHVNGITTSAQVTLETGLPSTSTIADLNSSYNTLTFKLHVTTSSGATTATATSSTNWMVSNSTRAICIGKLTSFGSYQLSDTLYYYYSVPIQAITTGPAYVRIDGTERVGKTLEAELYKADGSKFTTSSAVTYRWYNMDDDEDPISEGDEVDNDHNYKLVSDDKNDYIRLVVTYNGITYTDITGDIDKRSSSSSSSHDDDDDDDDNSSRNNRGRYIAEAHVEKDANGIMKLMENGRYISGWKLINGQWFLGDSLGNVQTGWRKDNGVWYFLKNDGVMATDWIFDGGAWYLLNNNGGMLTGWQLVGGKWYLLNGSGAMLTGWQRTNGKWYYLYGDGSMAMATVIDGYRVDITGAWIP